MIHNRPTLPVRTPPSRFGRLVVVALLAALGGTASVSGLEESGHDEAETMAKSSEDPYLWLEEIDGEKSMAWVEAQNAATAERLEKTPLFTELLAQAKAALGNTSRIPSFTLRGDYLYELWKDEGHPRGLYRRMRVSDLESENPTWQTVLDLDALGAAEGRTLVFKGMNCLEPENRHCLVSLSPGGGDAVEIREFDLHTREFVVGGFELPKAKTSVDWIDEDHLFVGTDFGPGSMTDSGYPRIARRWTRGTPIAEATILHEGRQESVSVRAGHYAGDDDTPSLDLLTEGLTFWTRAYYQIEGDQLHRLDIPESASLHAVWKGSLLIEPKDDWTLGDRTFKRGSLVLAQPNVLRSDLEPELRTGDLEVVFEPSEGVVLEGVAAVDQGILLTLLDQVQGRLRLYQPHEGGGFSAHELPFPDHGSLSVTTVDEESGDAFVLFETFVSPRALYHVSAADKSVKKVRQQDPSFDGSQMEVNQYWTTSADGTRVPYFVVAKKGLPRNGKNPTHIFSYGGFRNALTPSYSGSYEQLYGAYGEMWLERGGVFVLANIRGGGEFGPDWHKAALRENRERSFEDFEAIARDLGARKITSAEHLGIEGRSNGGLLVTATFTRHPELYGAVICGVPLADMKRYHKLLAGASWMAEFGDPDVASDWEFMKRYSPYQNLAAEKDYPAVFFYTSTRDDRVHPGHARKMAARMIELGYEVWYYENTEGGHGGSTTNDQLAYRIALAYTHLWQQLK